MSDYYETLGITHQADESEIRSAYRQRALEHHPDRNPDDVEAEQRFKEISEAYDILSNQEAREAYDEALLGYRKPKPSVSIKDILEGIGSVAGMFMEASARAHPNKVKPGRCTVCSGSGELALDLGVLHISKRCEACQGSGEIVSVIPSGEEIL